MIWRRFESLPVHVKDYLKYLLWIFGTAAVLCMTRVIIVLILQLAPHPTEESSPPKIVQVETASVVPVVPLTAEEARQVHRDIQQNAGKLVPEDVKQKVFTMIRNFSAQGLDEVKFDDVDLKLTWTQYQKIREPLRLYLQDLGYDTGETLMCSIRVSWAKKNQPDLPPPLPNP